MDKSQTYLPSPKEILGFKYGSPQRLSLSEIKSGRIDETVLRGAAWRRCCRRLRLPAKLAHPCPVISACAHRCSISDTIPAGGEDAAHQIQRHCPSTPA